MGEKWVGDLFGEARKRIGGFRKPKEKLPVKEDPPIIALLGHEENVERRKIRLGGKDVDSFSGVHIEVFLNAVHQQGPTRVEVFTRQGTNTLIGSAHNRPVYIVSDGAVQEASSFGDLSIEDGSYVAWLSETRDAQGRNMYAYHLQTNQYAQQLRALSKRLDLRNITFDIQIYRNRV